MTICVSAIATESDKKEVIVFATDHMISTHLGQFEKEIKKYKALNGNVVAMLSGQTLLFEKVLEGTEQHQDFCQIRDKIASNLVKIRKEIIKKEVHDLYGIDEAYIKNILPNPIQNPFIQKILEITAEFSLQTSILLIGFDKNGAQIAEIGEKGFLEYRDIDFHAIGSGSTQALNTMLFQKHSKRCNLKTAIYNVYKAKRNAEVAQGVGKETEVLILSKDSLKPLKEKDIDLLKDIYEKELNFGIKNESLNTLFT